MRDNCPWCGQDQHATGDATGGGYRTTGVEIQGVYDGVLYWLCPSCGGTWQRWRPGDWRYDAAQPHIHGPREKQQREKQEETA